MLVAEYVRDGDEDDVVKLADELESFVRDYKDEHMHRNSIDFYICHPIQVGVLLQVGVPPPRRDPVRVAMWNIADHKVYGIYGVYTRITLNFMFVIFLDCEYGYEQGTVIRVNSMIHPASVWQISPVIMKTISTEFYLSTSWRLRASKLNHILAGNHEVVGNIYKRDYLFIRITSRLAARSLLCHEIIRDQLHDYDFTRCQDEKCYKCYPDTCPEYDEETKNKSSRRIKTERYASCLCDGDRCFYYTRKSQE